MKAIFNPLIKWIVNTSIGWCIAKLIMRFAEWLRFEKSKLEHASATHKLKFFFNDLIVKDGYFKGLNYPGFSSFGSSLFPKLSGSYESELFPFFKQMETKKYDIIMDIGCAEGFYAIGLALKHLSATVEAFDIEPEARRLCRMMAEVNNVTNQIIISNECTPAHVKNIDTNLSTFIICDCEGYERTLFNEDNIKSLINADVLIELHPMHVKDVKEYLLQLFDKTHHLRLIGSYDDNRKLFDLPEMFDPFSKLERSLLVTEGRSFSMDWLIAIPK